MSRHGGTPKLRIWGTSAAALFLLPASIAWTGHVSEKGDVVAASVSLENVDLSGMSVGDATRLVDERAGELMSAPISVDTGSEPIITTAEEIGFRYDTAGVVGDALDARHTGGAGGVFLSWVGSLFAPVEIEDRISFDAATARRALLGDDHAILTPAVEPRLTMEGTNYLYPVPGSDGVGIDVEELVSSIGSLDLDLDGHRLTVGSLPIEPSITDSHASDIADRINELTAHGMEVLVGTSTETLTTAQLRRHLSVERVGPRLQYAFDIHALSAELERAIPGPVGAFEKPVFDIVDDEVVVESRGEVPPICCSLDSVMAAAEGILAGGVGPWRLEPKPSSDPSLTAWADGSAIVEKVAEFTTPHSCCKPRAKNIQRMADIVRGIYMLPGQELSLNLVAPRTRANGFVADGAIRFGRLTNEVGGGVSQFATTMFNSAYFAGLDFEEYRSHSIYFERYPFGREATVSTPKPDLVVSNTSDYPVLIWTSYDSTSITVTMYSTKHVEVEELGQRVGQLNKCTQVETDRQRTYPDGRVVVDTFEALYRPAEGLDCNGHPVIPPSGS